MKNLSSINSFLNEGLQPGEDGIANGTGVLTIKRTADNQGFNIENQFPRIGHTTATYPMMRKNSYVRLQMS